MRRALSIRTQVLSLCAALLLIAAGGQLLFGTFFAVPIFESKKAEIRIFSDNPGGYPGDDPARLYELLGRGRISRISGWPFMTPGACSTPPPYAGGVRRGALLPGSGGWDPLLPGTGGPGAAGRTREDAQLGLTGAFTFQGESGTCCVGDGGLH